ncbi:hypothetical protein [Serratia fonticola]|uniref:hypothetical protein n=1 Tax=Serratia fonticola TaxID=47917 RepID=UPI00217942D3|nr:hypothetical protein [Serratia fonticola]CAI1210659.1 Uncharacterised protein [Serratia fonticola]
MSTISGEAKQAGQLILSGLRQFNQAAVLFESYIEPAFGKSVELIVEAFVREVNWDGDLNWDKGEHWFASKTWKSNEEQLATFFDYVTAEGEQDYWLAVLTGQGTAQGEWGYRFAPKRANFGGTQNFNRWMRDHGSSLTSPLVELGFRDEGKGEFFLPVRFDLEQLAACWLEYGEFREDHELFKPLTAALETMKQSILYFDHLLEKASKAVK